jgi:DNA repair protein RecO (recombination protein O)
MLTKDKGVVLHRFKFGENALIAKIYTRNAGQLSFIFKGVFSPKSKFKAAHLTPLNIVEIDFENHPSKQIKKIKELNCKPVLHSIHLVSEKIALSTFILEIVNRAISDELSNPALYESLEEVILEIENTPKPPPWLAHLFVLQLLHHLGHGIDSNSFEKGFTFNLLEGTFSSSNPHPSFSVNETCSAALAQLIQSHTSELSLRKELLSTLIRFLHIHCIGNKPLQSLSLFSMIHASKNA